MASDPTLEEALGTFEDFLRTRGLKMTEQRRTMIRAALEHHGHFTAEDIHKLLGGEAESVSMATVYRCLALLEESGIVQGHDFADGQRRYEGMLRREHHDHIVCKDCGCVIEFQNPEIERLQQQIVAKEGFRIVDHVLNLYVTCDEWRTKGACARKAKLRASRGE